MEAPPEFRAPDVTLWIGLGIGRMVFRALNRVEVGLLIVVVVSVVAAPRLLVVCLAGALAVLLGVQPGWFGRC